ncbi:MAG: hypothetical protein U0Y68_16585 [Blastocatellia bacterium]
MVWVGWRVYERWEEHHLSVAAGGRATESYRLARLLQSVTTLHAPRFRLAILEIEGAASDEGVLEKGVVQLTIVPADQLTGPSARGVALLPGEQPQLLLARYDVDEGAVYALLQVLTQFSAELAPAKASDKVPAKAGDKTSGKAAAPAATLQQPPAASAASLHPGAVAFYGRAQASFLARYAKLLLLVLTGLVLLALWVWWGRRRAQQESRAQSKTPPHFAPSAGRAPWTFARILQESVAAAPRSAPITDETKKSWLRPTTWKQ